MGVGPYKPEHSLEGEPREQPSSSDSLSICQQRSLASARPWSHGARISGSPITSTVCQGSASLLERMCLLNGDNKAYNCVIKVLDFGARFPM